MLAKTVQRGRTAAMSSLAPASVSEHLVRTDDDRAVLEDWAQASASKTRVPATWIVFVKGRDAPLGEDNVGEAMWRFGFIDTKVAAMFERLTALRFAKKR